MDPVPIPGGAPSPPPCLIVGCGYVGTRLARRLSADREVRAVARSDASVDGLRRDGVVALQADLDAPGPAAETLRTAAAGATIVYLAPPPDSGVNDPRLAGFLAALGDARPSSLLYMSTTGVYGDTGGVVVTERAELAPTSDRARRRASAERVAIAWSETRGLRCVILRVPGIYGPNRLPLDRLQRDEPVLRPEDCGPGNRIHVDDLVTVCAAALDTLASGTINVADGDYASTTEYLCATAELAGLPLPRFVTREEARTQISPGMLLFLGETRRVDNTRMREVLRAPLRYPDMRAGIKASLEEMRRTVRD